ncbi:hypothetical protein H4219_001276 [Mycoemilia scoparia]|uniref:OPT family small oligopeptide transporter n=1 Tax=Mycoemilia scoparia TaxID=417184 RepID=A0A9W8A6Y8_9FUNG|nr:hypothetical protein H4219_001276 [Mycoemilia scoparia]
MSHEKHSEGSNEHPFPEPDVINNGEKRDVADQEDEFDAFVKEHRHYVQTHQSSPSFDQEGIADEKKLEDDSPYETVRATVSNTDDPTLPSFTFRALVIGLIFCAALSFVNQFFWFRENPISIGGFVVQLLSYPVGVLMSYTLPKRKFRTFGWEWTLNPGPFSVKEHVVASIIATAGSSTAYAIDIVTVKRMYYKSDIGFGVSVLLMLTTQVLGYSISGLARRFLVYPAAMIWPTTLVQVSLFRAFHDVKPLHDSTTGRRRMTRTLFFGLVFLASFIWYWVPGYLMTVLSMFPFLCLVAPNNLIANQLGDGLSGLGMFSFTLDWSMISNGYIGSPIAAPLWSAFNVIAGFAIVMWLLVPIGYYKNVWDSAKLPIYTAQLFNSTGQPYIVQEVLTSDLRLDLDAYEKVGPPQMTFAFALTYGFGFLVITAVITHIVLHYGPEIWARIKEIRKPIVADDVHARLMKNYSEVPIWWYLCLFVVMFVLSVVLCEVFNFLPWWGLILSLAIAAIFTIPVGIIQAVSNIQPGLNLITELICGYMLPGDPIANVTFKTFGYISMYQALSLTADQKLGHYMKIPPRHMFMAQLIGTVVAIFVQLAVAFWLMDTVKDMCVVKHGNNWTCIQAQTYFSASVIWGLIGPARAFGKGSDYGVLYWMFLIGAVLPIPFWLLSRKFPGSKIWRNVNIPVMLSAIGYLPPAATQDYPMWFFWCLVFNYFIHRWRNDWWRKYAFTFSAGMDAGVAVTTIIIFFATQNTSLKWWGNNYHCNLSDQPYQT